MEFYLLLDYVKIRFKKGGKKRSCTRKDEDI